MLERRGWPSSHTAQKRSWIDLWSNGKCCCIPLYIPVWQCLLGISAIPTIVELCSCPTARSDTLDEHEFGLKSWAGWWTSWNGLHMRGFGLACTKASPWGTILDDLDVIRCSGTLLHGSFHGFGAVFGTYNKWETMSTINHNIVCSNWVYHKKHNQLC